MKDLCKSCEHLRALGKTFVNGELVPYKFCSFKNISLQNLAPHESCDSYSVSELASPEEKYNAINL
jgi:hypothetical protein